MEILNHKHPRPNCSACEQVGRWQAEETVRRKLEAAEEMAETVKIISDLSEEIIGKSVKEYAINAYAAWNKAGKGEG